MLMSRRPDGTLEFAVTWKQFVADWRGADAAHRAVLDDGRPAVLRDTEDGVNYTTILPSIWDLIRPRIKEAMRLEPPKKREHLCEACRTPMRVRLERDTHWIFSCDRCKSVEIHGKDHVGGTQGAGEKETS